MSPSDAYSSDTQNMDRLIDLLVCPVTQSSLHREGPWLVAERGGLAYPIVEDIPVLLADHARLPDGYQTLEQFMAEYGKTDK